MKKWRGGVWLWKTRRGHGMETEHGEGRSWTLEGCAYSTYGAALCLHAAWNHCSYSCTVLHRTAAGGCVGCTYVSRDCVTSCVTWENLRAVSQVLLLLSAAFLTLEVSLYVSRKECKPNAVGFGAKAQYHLRGGAAGARPQRREEQ